MVEIGLHGGHATGVLAPDDVGHFLRHLEFDLLDGLAILNDVDRGVGVNQSEEVVVDVDDIVDFDDILLAHFLAVGIADERYIIVGLVKVQIVEHGDAVACLDVVDNNTFFYTIDF